MGSGLAFGSFASGLTEGIDKGRARAIQDEKMEWERADQKEKADMRAARTDLSTMLQSINNDSAHGKLPGSPDNLVEQQAQQTQPQTAIATPDQQAAPAAETPVQQEDRLKNPYTQNGEGLYKNQQLADDAKYKATRDAFAAYFVKTGQPEKVLTLDKAVNEMREAAYDPVRKHALAAVSSGQPGAMAAVNKFSQAAGLGFTYEGGEYDSKNHTWNNVKVTGADGKSAVENIPVATFGQVMGALTFDKALEIRFNREDTARKFAIDEKNADSQRISANASATKAGAESRYADARVNQLNNDAKGNDLKARVEAVNKFFPNADKVLKLDETVNMSKEQVAGKNAEIEADSKGRTIAGNLASLNPKTDLRVIAGFSRAAAMGNLPEKQIDKESGRAYVTHGGTKIFVN